LFPFLAGTQLCHRSLCENFLARGARISRNLF